LTYVDTPVNKIMFQPFITTLRTF